MNDRNNNTKTPESSHGAPAALTSAPFFGTFPFPPFDLPRPSTMPPRTFPDTPIYRTVENTYSSPTFEDDPREQTPSYRNPYSISRGEYPQEQAPVYNTHSTPESFMDRAMYSSIQMNDSILASFPCYPETSRAARPTTPADFKKHKSMIVREDEERAAKLRKFRDLYNLDLMSREEPERERSPSLMSTDESDSDYLYPDTESEPESEFFEEEESNPSPALDCTDDESDDDYTAPDSDSESESEFESGSEHEPEPSQEQGIPLSITEELRTLSPPGFTRSLPHIPSWNDMGPRDDDMLYNDLFGLVPAPPLSPYLPPTAHCTPTPPQEQEQSRSSSPVDDDSLSTLGQAVEKASSSLDDGSLDTRSQALKKHQPEDIAPAKPSLSQDLGKKVHSSLSAYDSNMEKLRKDIDEQSDRIRERCDRLEKWKRDRDNAVPPTCQEWVDAVFPGPSIPAHEREKVKLERVHRLAERYRERFGIFGNAIAGPSQEQEKKTSLSSKLDEMIRQKREKLRELQGDKVPEVGRVQDLGRACRVAAAAAWALSFDARPRLTIPKPNNAVSMSLEETGEEIDVLLGKHQAEEEKDGLPAMPNDSLSNIGPKKYPITRPGSLTLPQSMPCYHAISLTASRDHEPWRPETEILEAVSDKPFNAWVDITGMREFIHDELSRFGCSKVTVEACRVSGEENIRLMVFMPKRVHQWFLSLCRYRISNRLSLWGITDVKVEIWETDFHLQVI